MLQTFLATLNPMLMLFICIAIGFVLRKTHILPENVSAEAVSGLKIAEYPEIRCCGSPFAAAEAVTSEGRVTLSLFGAIPVKSVEVHERPAPVLVAGGSPFGIKLVMEGVMVTEIGGIDAESGEITYPAKSAGIKVGDVIRLADGQKVTSNGHLQEIIGRSGGRPVTLSAALQRKSFPLNRSQAANGVAECGYVTALRESAR